MKNILKILLVFIAVYVVIFWPLFLKGQLPFPGNLLVSFYFPWSSGGFNGFDPWTTRKDVIAMDVIRQMYPWKTLAFDMIKNFQLPLWNPYNFSGTPLLANLQSSVFFPTNILYLIFPYIFSWTAHVVLLPFFFSVFSYIFLRSLKLSKLACIFGAIAAANISYITVWAEQIVVIQSVLFLPLILLAVNKKKYWPIPILLVFCFLGGHIQTVAYVYIIVVSYLFYSKVTFKKTFIILFLAGLLSCIQLVPSVELYLNSAREGTQSKELFYASTLPWKNLVTVFAPDYFGNPATNNYTGRDYGNFQTYFGIVAILLAIIGFKKNKFFATLGILGLIFSLAPFAYGFDWFHIPILSSGYPSRMIFIFQFCMVILAAYGFDHIPNKKIYLLALIPLILFIFAPNKKLVIIPSAILLSSLFILRFKRLWFILIIFAVIEYTYFFNKYQPFSPSKFVFPSHPVFTFLQNNAGIDRYFGFDRAYIDNNFATYYKVYAPEGYDPLYIKRYSELLSFADNKKEIPRSDAFLGKDNTDRNNRLYSLLGIKYIIDKTDTPETDWGPNFNRFPQDKYSFLQQINKWKFYERKSTLPRIFMVGNFVIGSLGEIFNNRFDLGKTLILEETPKLLPEVGEAKVSLVTYQPNKIVFETTSDKPKLLFISDTFYPGWNATVDGFDTKIYRANYVFRAVAVPSGQHTIIMEYFPNSFKIGIVISLLGVLLLCSRKLI